MTTSKTLESNAEKVKRISEILAKRAQKEFPGNRVLAKMSIWGAAALMEKERKKEVKEDGKD